VKDERVDDVINSLSASLKKAAGEGLAEKTIGEHVLKLVARDGDVSLETLAASLQAQMDNAAHGKGSNNLKPDYVTAESALGRLRSCQP
jgi:hypothetical protein